MKTALVIIDMQQGCFATPRHDAAGLVVRLNALTDRARGNGAPIIFIQHEGPEGTPFHPASAGWKLLPSLQARPGDHFVGKTSCDSFLDTMLQPLLQNLGIRQLVITGCATDYCVDTTVRSALARSYRTIVPSDGHTTADRPHLAAAKIIEHHNAVWADFIAPAGPARICSCAEVPLP